MKTIFNDIKESLALIVKIVAVLAFVLTAFHFFDYMTDRSYIKAMQTHAVELPTRP